MSKEVPNSNAYRDSQVRAAGESPEFSVSSGADLAYKALLFKAGVEEQGKTYDAARLEQLAGSEE